MTISARFLLLSTTCFKYNDRFYRQEHGCVMCCPESLIVASTYNIMFLKDDAKLNKLFFFGLSCPHKQNGLNTELRYTRNFPTQASICFLTHTTHRNTNCQSSEVYTTTLETERQEKEHKHIKKTLQTCSYPNWAFVKLVKKKNTTAPNGEEKKNRYKNIMIPYVAGGSEKLSRISSKHNIQYIWNLRTPSDKKKRFTWRTKHPHRNCELLYYPYSSVKWRGHAILYERK